MSNGSFWIIGTGGGGATAALNISSFATTGLPSAQIVAIDTNNYSSTVVLNSLPDSSGGPAGNFQARQVWNTNGTIAFPSMPNLPSSGTVDLVIDPSGNVTTQMSTLRVKDNVEPLNDDFHKILALEPKSFRYKDTGFRGIGYAAEEADQLELSDLVSYDGEGRPLTINYKLIPIYLLEILKKQDKTIQALQEEIVELRASTIK